MNIEFLKAFAAAARHGNVTKAASELKTSQPAVSKQLRKLEETYNVQLFSRSGIGVELTQEGREFLSHVERVLEHMQNLEKRFFKQPNPLSFSALRVGAEYAISAKILPELLGSFKKRHTHVDVLLRSNMNATLERMVMRGELDLGVLTVEPNNPDLISEPCMRMKIIAVVARGFPLLRRKTIRLEDLKKAPLIVQGGPDGGGITATFFQKLRHQGVKPKILMRCDSPEAIKTAVLKKMGVGILYEDIVEDEISRGVFKHIRIDGFSAEVQTFVVYQKHHPLSAAGESFLVSLRSEASRQNLANPPLHS